MCKGVPDCIEADCFQALRLRAGEMSVCQKGRFAPGMIVSINFRSKLESYLCLRIVFLFCFTLRFWNVCECFVKLKHSNSSDETQSIDISVYRDNLPKSIFRVRVNRVRDNEDRRCPLECNHGRSSFRSEKVRLFVPRSASSASFRSLEKN